MTEERMTFEQFGNKLFPPAPLSYTPPPYVPDKTPNFARVAELLKGKS